jgi:DNA-binding FadR family transcriptional regulator
MVEIGSAATDRSQGDERPIVPGAPLAPAGGSAHIAAQLRRAILQGEYSYGERLQAERQLADHFNASRSTVREALRQLADMHLVTRRVGSGTFVSYRHHFDDDNIAEVTSPLELIEVRLAIEPHLARLAVANASARDLDRMAEALRKVESCGRDRELFSRSDEQFHLAFSECTRNPLMVWLYRHINDVRGHKQWAAMKDKILSGDRINHYNQEHRALYEAVRSRDLEGAVRIITQHLETARRDLLGVKAR